MLTRTVQIDRIRSRGRFAVESIDREHLPMSFGLSVPIDLGNTDASQTTR